MNQLVEKLEREKVSELAREYEMRGYSVVISPKPSELPQFLQRSGYIPDLIAKSENMNFIIEIRSRETIRNNKVLAGVSDLVQENQGWRFVLVYTNPRQRPQSIEKNEPEDINAINSALREVSDLINRKGGASRSKRLAALLLAWSTLEAVLIRSLPQKATKRPRTSPGLVRDAVTAGLISRETFLFLESAMAKRNAIAHGVLSESVDAGVVRRLVDVCEAVIAER